MSSARTFSLFIVLFGLWLLLSGRTDPFLVGCGAASAALVAALARRMDAVDGEGHPIGLAWRFPVYLPWLAWRIALANLAVVRAILRPVSALDPASGWIDANQRTPAGLVAFANSITLTPGTVSLTALPGRIHVHALSRDDLDELKEGEMDRRVCAMEGQG